MGLVFTSFFSLGLLLIVQTADTVDLDPNCVLYGAIELAPLDVVDLWGIDSAQNCHSPCHRGYAQCGHGGCALQGVVDLVLRPGALGVAGIQHEVDSLRCYGFDSGNVCGLL